MAEYDTPGIRQAPLEELLLFSLGVCGCTLEALGLLDAPDAADIQRAKERLKDWGFVSETADTMRAGECDDDDAVLAGAGISLTRDGKLASSLDRLAPESVRMILTACNRYPQCLYRAIKLAVLMASDKELMRASNNPQTAVGMDVDLAARSHALGDHFLALEQFEGFDTLEQKRGKSTRADALKNRCGVNGLDFEALCGVQKD
eukprot:3532102-Rhodomonas_salina.1